MRTETAAASLLIVTHPLLPTEPHLPQSVPDTVVDAAAADGRGRRRAHRLPAARAGRFAGPPLSRAVAEFGRRACLPCAVWRWPGRRRCWSNAVGVGTVYDADLPISGDPGFLGRRAARGGLGPLAEAVAAVLFFADPANTYTTGQLLAVDGGWMAGYGPAL